MRKNSDGIPRKKQFKMVLDVYEMLIREDAKYNRSCVWKDHPSSHVQQSAI